MRSALLCILVLLLAVPVQAEGRDLTVRSIPLDREDPGVSGVGALQYLGGLEIESNLAAFGGWSDGWATEDLKSLVLVSDRGQFVEFALKRDPEKGVLIDLESGPLQPLLDMEGHPLAGQFRRDAESLANLGEGAFAVGFERDHRIWLYSDGLEQPARARIGPAALADLPAAALNSGVEAMARSPDGQTLIAILEGPRVQGQTTAFIRRDGRWQERVFASSPGFGVTAASYLASGDLLVLERFFSPATGPIVNLLQVAAGTLAGEGPITGDRLAVFRRPMSVDNFEILVTGRDGDGSSLILIGSDDNFNDLQRFLLLLFRFNPKWK